MLILGIMLAGMGGSLQAMKDPIQAQRELLQAIYEGDEEKTIAAIVAGANVNQFYPSGSSLLETAAQHDKNDIVKVLLSAGAGNASKALRDAAYNAQGAVVKTLLAEANADAYAKNHLGEPLLVLAVQNQNQSSIFRFQTTKVILQHLIQLTADEKKLLKNWLLVDQRLRAEGKGLHKDLKKPIAHWIMHALAQDVLVRIIRAGGLEALQNAQEQKDSTLIKLIKLLEDFLSLDSLETEIFKQQTLKNT